MSTSQISHIGIVKSINNQQLIVKITSQTACSACHVKGNCASSEQEEKEIEVTQSEASFRIGEVIQVITTVSQGYTAVLFAYVLPLILLVTALVTFLSLNTGEAGAAIASLLILSCYYFLLYSFRDKIKNTFHFIAQKLPNITSNE